LRRLSCIKVSEQTHSGLFLQLPRSRRRNPERVPDSFAFEAFRRVPVLFGDPLPGSGKLVLRLSKKVQDQVVLPRTWLQLLGRKALRGCDGE
jgi:hypothetical protein